MEPDEIQTSLDQLISIISSAPAHALRGIKSTVIDNIHSFAEELSKIQKFQKPDIQYLVILSLFYLGLLQANVSGCVSALAFMMTLPSDFSVNNTLSTLSLDEIEYPGYHPYVLPLMKTGHIIDFIFNSASSYFLSEKNGLFAVTNDPNNDSLHVDVNVTPGDKIVLYHDRIYLFYHRHAL